MIMRIVHTDPVGSPDRFIQEKDWNFYKKETGGVVPENYPTALVLNSGTYPFINTIDVVSYYDSLIG